MVSTAMRVAAIVYSRWPLKPESLRRVAGERWLFTRTMASSAPPLVTATIFMSEESSTTTIRGCSTPEYTWIGDTVNVASRLSQRARAGEALFSSTVRKALQDGGTEVTLLELPAMQLRGRVSPVEIFCIPAPERLDLRPAMTL